MPEDRLFTVTLDGIAISNDLGCGWQQVLALDRPSDVFPDPTDADRVFAIARAPADGGTHPQGVYASNDGGKTWGDPLFSSAENAYVTGIEVAASDDDTLYVSLTLFETKESHPYLVRSQDGGKSWKMIALEPSIGMQLPRILAVDKEEAKRVYLRLGSTGKDSLGLYDDNSGKVDVLLTLDTSMSAFLRRADGSLLVGAADGSAFVMKAGGKSFSKLSGTPHLRGLGERAGTLYATTDSMKDGYAFAASDDDGKTWKPLIKFEDIAGIRQCGTLASTCASDWDMLQMRLANPTEPGFDAGEPVKPPKPKKDDGCSASAGAVRPDGALGAAVLVWLGWRRRRARAVNARR
jgi:MYXO-CTERM domain-containing protein